MTSLIAVLCFVVAAQATKLSLPDHMHNIVTTKGKQYELYKTYTESIKLSEQDQKDCFSGLDSYKRDNVINREDLNLFYWYKDVKYAIKKFLVFVEDNADEKVTLQELNDEFKEKPVKVALVECHFLKSPGLRESCFADQLLTYASLVLEDNDVDTFYKDISGGDKKLTADEVHKLKDAEDSVAEELGAYHGPEQNLVTEAEFKDYVTQESINDDFRRCREKVDEKKGEIDYKSSCLEEELVEYINDDLTEMDISVLFRAVDKNDNKKITKDEIDALPGIDGEDMINTVMKLLDMSLTTPEGQHPEVDYAEFRTYMKSPTVQIQMERDCTEKTKTQKEELDCLFDLFVKLAKHSHSYIWLTVPDLEQQITFEILDTTNDGVITESELEWYPKTNKRFIAEMDTDDKGVTVDLEEFNEYVDIPHMVYGVGECLLKPRLHEEGRVVCYPDEIGKVLHNIKDLDKQFWETWFSEYESNTDDNNYIDIHDDKLKTKVSAELVPLFLSELGQGDTAVTLFEFTWYAKQQELALRYKDNFDDKGAPICTKFHDDLMKWIEDDITEFDIQQFFGKMDINKDHDLSKEDFKDAWPRVEKLIKHIDSLQNDGDDTANFREFWLWLNSEYNKPERGPKVKDVFERDCTKEKKGPNQQEEEINCYVDLFKNHVDLFVS